MKRYCIAALLLAMTVGSQTVHAAEGITVARGGFSFVLPAKWTMPKDEQPKGRRRAEEKIVLITRDGIPLNNIEFKERLLSAAFEHTKKALTPAMLPQEMAGVVLNDFELNKDIKNFRMLENKPATVAGNPGFRIVFSYKREGTLQYRCVYYGFKEDDMFFSIMYSAPKRHYFEANLDAFEQIMKSLKLEEKKSAWSPGTEN